jgi:hypothetical protein
VQLQVARMSICGQPVPAMSVEWGPVQAVFQHHCRSAAVMTGWFTAAASWAGESADAVRKQSIVGDICRNSSDATMTCSYSLLPLHSTLNSTICHEQLPPAQPTSICW